MQNFKVMNLFLYRYAVYLLLFTGCLCVGSCKKDYEQLNKNPEVATSINPNSQLTYIQLSIGGDWLLMQPFTMYYSGFVQQLQGDWAATHYGGEYLIEDAQFQQPWDRIYTTHLKNLTDILWRTEGQEQWTNVNAVARILKAYFFLILTDMYGDIPYSEADMGYIHQNISPKFDTQESIYADMHAQLLQAEEQLRSDGDNVTGDVMYNGDIKKWKTYANTLNLRISMSMTKKDTVLERQWIDAIVANRSGFIKEGDDGILKYTNILDWDPNEFRRNGLAQLWRSRENYPMPYLCTTLWNMLKNTEDPRLLVLARCYAEDSNDPDLRTDLTDFIVRNGPLGINQLEAVKPGFYWWDNWPAGFVQDGIYYGKECRPQLNKGFVKGSAPYITLSYAETALLLSEAKLRWNDLPIQGSAEEHYTKGVQAAIKLLTVFDLDQKILPEETTAYLVRNPFPADRESRLKSINEQLWLLHITNPPEAFSNWRRSGYPVLKPSTEYGALVKDSRTIPRRLKYPLFEQTYNPRGYKEAVTRMGGTDSWNIPVWWDHQ